MSTIYKHKIFTVTNEKMDYHSINTQCQNNDHTGVKSKPVLKNKFHITMQKLIIY